MKLAFRLTLFALAVSLSLPFAPAADDLEALEEQAVRAAVERVGQSVVQIQTVGGLEKVGVGKGAMLAGTGPTTGLIVSEDGYVVSSAFNFAQKPASILVSLPDGSRAPAKLIATDRNRQLVLLKIEVQGLKVGKLTAPDAVPGAEVKVGQWAVAVGRTFEGASPNISVGIVSATRRIWGKALQTDAKISPANYGGPLCDIRGRVLGILVPLSPEENSEAAGVEWYDSGIGFAVPLDEVLRMLPRFKEGKDLHPGVMGISFKTGDALSGEPVVGAIRAGSPAAEAGMKTGDRLVEVDGRPVVRQAEVKQALGPRYAGEQIAVAVMRDKERHELKLTLVDKLDAYQHPFLGVLPLRTARSDADGVRVRFVYPQSAADKAGIKAGDVITSVAGTAVKRRDDMLETMNTLKFGQKAPIVLKRNDVEQTVEAQFTGVPEFVPTDVPEAHAKNPNPPGGDRLNVGALKDRKITEFANTYMLYVPEAYEATVPHGIVMWLHEPGGYKDDELLARWKPLCDKYDLILAAPKSADASKWLPTEMGFLKKVLDEVLANYNVDRSRIVATGYQTGGTLAVQLAFAHRDLIRAACTIDGPLAAAPGENEPNQRLAFYLTNADKAPKAPQIKQGADALRKQKFPVTLKEQGKEQPRNFNDTEVAEFVRWVDTLDRM